MQCHLTLTCSLIILLVTCSSVETIFPFKRRTERRNMAEGAAAVKHRISVMKFSLHCAWIKKQHAGMTNIFCSNATMLIRTHVLCYHKDPRAYF